MTMRKACKDTCLWHCVNTKPGKYTKFVILLWLDLLNLCVDWYFYIKIQLVEPGLVYGPPSDMIKLCTLIFCMVSIMSFVVETMHNTSDLFYNRKIKFINQSVTNFSVIYFEDIPLLVLNLIVTMCRDGEPTLVSVIKSSVCIGVVGIRLMLVLVVHWLFESKKSKSESTLDFFSIFGLFIVASLSCTIQLLNNFPTNVNGKLQVADPIQFNRMHYVTNKYLNGAGVYARWPLDSKENNSYIFLANITQVIDQTYLSISIRSNYTLNQENYTLCFVKSGKSTCYSIHDSVLAYQHDSNVSSLILASDSYLNRNGFDLAMMREPAQEYKYKIGYLDYNLNRMMTPNQTSLAQKCESIESTEILYAKFFAKRHKDAYLKTHDATGLYSFYSGSIDLVRVNKLWRIGLIGCEMSGDLGPKLSRSIRLTC